MMAKSIGQSVGGSPTPGAIPLEQVFREVKQMQPAQKSALMQKAVQGMGTLPPAEQAQLISLGMKLQKTHVQSGQAMTAEQQATIILAQDAFKDVPEEELSKVAACAQQTAIQAAQDPARLMMVAAAMPIQDRLELKQSLVETKLVSPEQEALLTEALQPNGPLDQLAIAAQYLEMAKPYATKLQLVPLVEWGLGFVFAQLSCEASFPEWLCWDAFGMVFTYIGFYAAHTNFEVIKAIAMNPPPQLQEAALTQNFGTVAQAIPQENKVNIMIGAAGVVVAVSGLICQALWAVWGVLMLLNPFSCNLFVSFVCKIVIAAKSVLVLGMIVYSILQGKEIYEKTRVGGSTGANYFPVNQNTNHP